MVIMAGLAGIGTAVIDLSNMSEDQKRAAKAGVWVAAGAIGGATGVDSSSAVVGAAMAAKEIAGIVVDDESAMKIVDAASSAVAGAATGNYMEIGKVAATAAAGAAIGAAADGVDGVDDGIALGAQFGSGNASAIAAKAVGAAGGVAAGLAATPSGGSKADNMIAGAKLGMSVASATAATMSSQGDLEASRALQQNPSSLPATDEQIVSARVGGASSLTGMVVGASVGATEDRKDGSAFQAAESRAGLGSSIASSGFGLGAQIESDASSAGPTNSPEQAAADEAAHGRGEGTSPAEREDAEIREQTAQSREADSSDSAASGGPTPEDSILPTWMAKAGQYTGHGAQIGSMTAGLVIKETIAKDVDRLRELQRHRVAGTTRKLEAAEARLGRAETLTDLGNSVARFRSLQA